VLFNGGIDRARLDLVHFLAAAYDGNALILN
jgi:hypothetical protein